jgi:hypothetical protein
MPPDVDWRVTHCGTMCRVARFCFSNTLNEIRNGQLRSTSFFPFSHPDIKVHLYKLYQTFSYKMWSHARRMITNDITSITSAIRQTEYWRNIRQIMAGSTFRFSWAFYILFACIRLLFYIRLWKCNSVSFFWVCFAVHLIIFWVYIFCYTLGQTLEVFKSQNGPLLGCNAM